MNILTNYEYQDTSCSKIDCAEKLLLQMNVRLKQDETYHV